MMKRYKSIKEKAFPKEEAYWISPSGKILPLTNMSNHISEIIKNPKAFGYTSEQLKDIFTKEGEKFGVEGKAREKIILDLFKKGWIRIRRYFRPDRWTVNVPNLKNKIKDYLQYWAKSMIDSGWGKYDEVYIDSPIGAKYFNLSDISNDILYMEENKDIPKEREKLVFVEDVFDIKTNKI